MATSELPGDLSLVLDFVNSIELEHGTNPLAGPDDLAGWCERYGLCGHASEMELARLREFREALRAVLEANAGEGDEAAAWEAMKPFAQQACYRLRITAHGRPALDPAGAGTDAAIARLLAVAYDAIGAGTWQRLKACRKASCRWAFYDRSKNGSGAWCNMAVCGNRVKAQRRRQRAKSD
jgi:predicted RNA-binding Zn ribbon-like protein